MSLKLTVRADSGRRRRRTARTRAMTTAGDDSLRAVGAEKTTHGGATHGGEGGARIGVMRRSQCDALRQKSANWRNMESAPRPATRADSQKVLELSRTSFWQTAAMPPR